MGNWASRAIAQPRADWAICQQIWQENYPPLQPRRRSNVEKLLLSVLLFVRSASPVNLVGFFVPIDEVFLVDVYVLPWVVVLSVFLFEWRPLTVVTVALVVWRIVDILDYRLCVLLIDSEVEGWKRFSPTRSTVAFFLNLYEIMVSYAVLYVTVGHLALGSTRVESPAQVLYFSIVTMATVGYGDVIPADDFSRVLVILQLATGLVFVLAIAPAVLSILINRLQQK